MSLSFKCYSMVNHFHFFLQKPKIKNEIDFPKVGIVASDSVFFFLFLESQCYKKEGITIPFFIFIYKALVG